MKYRKLRLAWSVACGVACLLLVALWVRSYWWTDLLRGPSPMSSGFNLASIQGEVGLCVFRMDDFSTMTDVDLVSEAYVAPTDQGQLFAHPKSNPNWGFRFGPHPLGFMVIAPHWFWILLCGATGALPWIRWSFSLRTLLVVMTLIAVGLGWAVYILRL